VVEFLIQHNTFPNFVSHSSSFRGMGGQRIKVRDIRFVDPVPYPKIHLAAPSKLPEAVEFSIEILAGEDTR
jgi:hypothetical protein